MFVPSLHPPEEPTSLRRRAKALIPFLNRPEEPTSLRRRAKASVGTATTVQLGGSTANGKTTATTFGYGGGASITIPSGQMFAGRTAGGGARPQIYGSRTYGSGYPFVVGRVRGVEGRGLPYWFWPIVWTGEPDGSYLSAPEFGPPTNTSRLGGPMAEATFISHIRNTSFHILADNATVSALISNINTNCSIYLTSTGSTAPQPFDGTAPGAPQPEQAVQYYRASTIVLTVDGYNNSATFSDSAYSRDTPISGAVDMTLLDCLNYTIGQSAPLVSGAGTQWTGPTSVPLLGMVWLVWWMLHLL